MIQSTQGITHDTGKCLFSTCRWALPETVLHFKHRTIPQSTISQSFRNANLLVGENNLYALSHFNSVLQPSDGMGGEPIIMNVTTHAAIPMKDIQAYAYNPEYGILTFYFQKGSSPQISTDAELYFMGESGACSVSFTPEASVSFKLAEWGSEDKNKLFALLNKRCIKKDH